MREKKSTKRGSTTYRRKLIERLDKVFSQYIRLKYALPGSGICFCISCHRPHHWTDIQNGHYMSRRYMATRWSVDNCRPQCVACNIFNQGNIQAYRRSLVAEMGEQKVNMVEVMARTAVAKYGHFELEAMIDFYTGEVKRIRQEKGL